MKRLNSIILSTFLYICICTGVQVHAQSNDPAASSGYTDDTPEFWMETPQLSLSAVSEATLLPTEVDNSTLMYFPQKIINGEVWREIYIQDGNGACAAASTVHYTLTYELNRVRELSGLPLENRYPANFTWNYLNDGIFNKGSTFEQNLSILSKNGSPNRVVVGDWPPSDYTRWMSGYDNFFYSYHNRIDGYSQIGPMYDLDKHMLMKHWLADHNEGSTTGGLIVFSTIGACTNTVVLPPQSAHAGEKVVVNWSSSCSHAMTIVGYCDDIKYDFNGDGQYTNTIDLNNDGILDVRDWEIGAFIVVGLGHYDYAQHGFV